jgi:1-acyl-sn-glycerol-3-phosphate acyltransferase
LAETPQRRREPVEPSPETKKQVDRASVWLRPFMRTVLWRKTNVTVSGRENIPKDGPALIISNHVNLLDPVSAIISAGRNIHFLATESTWDEPFPAFLAVRAGAVPRKKFVTDSRSIRMMKGWRDLGGLVGLFPEGERTWDGRRLPILPGIEKLVRLVNAPVITTRIVNGYRQHPRWAVHRRIGRIHVEFDAPKTFDRKTPLEDIRAYIEDRLSFDPDRGQEWPMRGHRLAEGLANLLFACPNCHKFDTLIEVGDVATCGACGAPFRIDTENRLHDLRGGGPPTPLSQALDTMKARLADGWYADAARFERDAVALESDPCELLALGGDHASIGKGRLRLTPEALLLVDEHDPTDVRWRLPLAEMRAVAVDMRRRLQFRDSDARGIEAVMPRESVMKWYWIADHWRKRAGAKDLDP